MRFRDGVEFGLRPNFCQSRELSQAGSSFRPGGQVSHPTSARLSIASFINQRGNAANPSVYAMMKRNVPWCRPPE
jgi:hypothetical protein